MTLPDILVEDQELNDASVGINVVFSSNIAIRNNTCSNNNYAGIFLDGSSNSSISHNDCSNNRAGWSFIYSYGICLDGSDNNIISRNNCSSNRDGICIKCSRSNVIHLNNFINSMNNVNSYTSVNIWNSTSKINYTYREKTFANYLGNYWDDYTGSDSDKDGIGDSPYRISSDADNYPLMMPFENYVAPTESRTQVRVNAPEVVSGTFNATIDISNVVDLDCGQFDLSFDPGVVNVTAVNDGRISGEQVPIDSWEFIDADTITVISGPLGATGLRGKGRIATISFEVTGSRGATCVLDISNGTLTDTVADEIPAIWNDSAVIVGVPVTVSAPEVVSIASGTFNATIEIEDVTDLHAGQFDIIYDPDVLKVLKIEAGDINGTEIPIVGYRYFKDDDYDRCRVLFKLNGTDGVSGSGCVARIDFEITGSQSDTSVLDISDGWLFDTVAEIPSVWNDCEVTLGVPVTVSAPPVVSGAFEVTIEIENVTDLGCGQFDLFFNSSVVNVTGVSAGNISGTAVPIDLWRLMDAGRIRVLFNLPGFTGVSGSGQIATISFETTGPEGYSVLGISDGLLVDASAYADTIPAIWADDMVISGENTPVNRVHNLNTGEDFSFIQDAIDDPNTRDGHVIVVGDGVYRENDVR